MPIDRIVLVEVVVLPSRREGSVEELVVVVVEEEERSQEGYYPSVPRMGPMAEGRISEAALGKTWW